MPTGFFDALHVHQDVTPSLAPSQHPDMQSHFPPASTTPSLHSLLVPFHTPAPHSHLCFGYKQPVPGMPLGFVSAAAQDRATHHIRSNHSVNTCTYPIPTHLGKVHKRALIVPPSSPYQRVFVCGTCAGTTQVGVSLVSLFDPIFIRSRLHCLDVCLT